MHRGAQAFLDLGIPPLCPLCREEVLEDFTLCPNCWEKISFVAHPLCDTCGRSLDLSPTPLSTCGACLKDPPPFSKTRAAFHYAPYSKTLILRFKHGDATHLAPLLAQWMARDTSYFEGIEGIIPVPLHWRRLWKRGFNQSLLLARSLSDLTQKPLWTGILRRHRATPSQGLLPRARRMDNVKGAFSVAEKQSQRIHGKSLLLVDDVMASGATLKACTKALLTAGAKEVRVSVACRSNG